MGIDIPTGSQFTGFEGGSLALLVGGGAAMAAWLLLFAWRWFATFPRMPDAGPETTDLGPEPPAVVNLLVNRWRVTRTSMAATLVDLAARRYLGIEQYGDDVVVRVRDAPSPGDSLSPYESQVMDWVRSRATGRSAPIEALDLGDPGEAGAWRKRFSKSVVNDARSRRLARTRWTRADWTLLGIVLAAALALLASAFALSRLGESRDSTSDSFAPSDWYWIGAVTWIAAMVGLVRLRDLRDTPAGSAACARWLGVRQYLRSRDAFDDLPPSAVTVWERYLAYGVALGAAQATTEALPFAAADPEVAWSRTTGTWRQIRVRYPERFGFGDAPILVLLGGLGRTVLFGGIAVFLFPIVLPATWGVARDMLRDIGETDGRILALAGFFTGIFGLMGLYIGIRLLAGLIRLVRGALDVNRSVALEGNVVKTWDGRVAVDDGKVTETVALRFPKGMPATSRGDHVKVMRSPHLWHVRSFQVVERAQPSAAPAVSATRAAAAATAAPAALTPALLREITGLDLAPMASASQFEGLSFPGASSQRFGDGNGNEVGVARYSVKPGLSGIFLKALTAMPGRAGATVDGIGGHAWWLGDKVLLVEDDGQFVAIEAEFAALDSSARLAVARKLAEAELALPAVSP
ncbi:MAG: DUF2207 domain-containing protein [Chloroflexi bacterium]|nr:DUF2207 domain-containing protein [Chloroflexota bacterium]